MGSRIYRIVLAAAIVFFYINGCKDSPTENIYNIITADSLSNPDVNPRVIFTNPADGSTGPYGSTDPTQYQPYPQITIQFNKLINLTNFGLNPVSLSSEDTEYPLTLIQGYSDIFTNILVYDVNNMYMASKTYTLTIDTTFIDVHGKKLQGPYIAEFVPEPNFRVFQVYPTSTDIEPQQLSFLHLTFNSKLDSTILSSVSVSPNINGNWTLNYYYYYNDSTSIFYIIDDTLSYNTEYTVAVASDAKDYKGLLIDKAYQYTFKTVPFQVSLSSYSSYIGPGGFYIYNNFHFRFNAAVDTSTVRSSISVSPQISHNILIPYGTNSNYVYIDFNSQEFQNHTEYTIYFDSTIKSIYGDALEEYSYSFTTGQ